MVFPSFESMGVINFGTYLIGAIFIILLPGPNSLYVLTVAAQKGWKTGVLGGIGIMTGDTLLMLLAALGAASLMMNAPTIYALIKIAGAIYLSYLGYKLILLGIKRWQMHGQAHAAIAPNPSIKLIGLHPTKAAMMLSLTNPKGIVFFVSFFTQFLDAYHDKPWQSFLVLGITLQILSLGYLSLLILMGSRLAQAFSQKHRFAAWATASVGLLFIGFSLKLLLD